MREVFLYPPMRIPGRNGIMRKGHIAVDELGAVGFFPFEAKPGREAIPHLVLQGTREENIAALKAVLKDLEEE